MLNQLMNHGAVRFALLSVFVLVIVGSTAAVAVPAWSQIPAQEEEIAAIEAENAQVRAARAGRAGRASMFERMATYFRGDAGAQAGMMGRRSGMAGTMHGRRGGMTSTMQSRRPGFAAGPMGAMRGSSGIRGGRFDLASRALGRAEDIGLTDVQKQGIEEARDAQRRQQIEREASMKLVGLDLVELLGDDNADLTAVEQKMHEAADFKVQGQMAALRYRRNVQGILTTEQIEQLSEMAADFMRRRPAEDRAPRTRSQR